MHVAILASTSHTAERTHNALGNPGDRYTFFASWPDVAACLEEDRPDLILVERDVLARADLSTLLKLVEMDRWPPVLIVDTLSADDHRGIALARRFAQPPPQYHQIGELRIDTRKRRAALGERWVTLPPLQYHLLLTLVQHAGEVVDCQELLRSVWGYEAGEIEARELVKVHIRQIRRRLGLEPEKHHYIHSVRGFGYMLAPPEED